MVGQIPCPRYDPVYAFRHKDGVQFPLETFAANKYFSYSGDYVESKRHGAGVIVAQDGSSIAGEFHNGEITGYGVHTWHDGTVYSGQLLKGEAHGEGEQIWASGGAAYKGSFACGLMHGQGRWTRYVSREVYEGSFVQHKRHGHGQWTVAGEFTYTGDFRDGVPCGNGTLIATAQSPNKLNKPFAPSPVPVLAIEGDVTLPPPAAAPVLQPTTLIGQFVDGLAEGSDVLFMTQSDQGESICYTGPMEKGLRTQFPRSILPLTVYVRDPVTTATEYLLSGKAPPPPQAGGRGNRDQSADTLFADPFLPVFVGTSIRVSAMQSTMSVPNPMGVPLNSGQNLLSPSGVDKRSASSSSAASKPLTAMNLPKQAGARGAGFVPIRRSKHVLDELCAKLRPPPAIVSGTTSGDPLQRTPNTPSLGAAHQALPPLPPPLSLAKVTTPPSVPLLALSARSASVPGPSATATALRNCRESGRRVRLSMYRCPQGEDPFTCHTSSLMELGQYSDEAPEAPWCFFKEDTTAAQVAVAIGEALVASKKNPGSATGLLRLGRAGGAGGKTPSTMRSPNASKPTTARTVDTQRKTSVLGGGPLDEIQPSTHLAVTANPSPLMTTDIVRVAGGESLAEFHIRLAPTVTPGDYVLVLEVQNPYILSGPLQQQPEYHDIQPLRIPVRVCPMDFQMQKTFLQLVEGSGNAAPLSASGGGLGGASSVASGEFDLPIPDSDMDDGDDVVGGDTDNDDEGGDEVDDEEDE